MSNVLIGIIGVILFIGLALAGALFLGPRFQESTQNSKAAATVQGLQQFANAAAMKNVQEGVTMTIGDTASLVPGYLKTIPDSVFNPSTADTNLQVRLKDVISDGVGTASSVAKYAIVRVHPATDANLAICSAINAQTNGSRTIPTVETGSVGCMQGPNTAYFAYARI